MDREEIKALIDILKDTDVTDFELEREGIKIRLKREMPMASFDLQQAVRTAVPQQAAPALAPAPAPAAPAAGASEENGRLVTITAPLVGTFYRSSSPETPAFVEAGDRVKKGQVICIVEAMKLMNEIESEHDGVVVKVLVDNSQPVEYGEPLFLIDPA